MPTKKNDAKQNDTQVQYSDEQIQEAQEALTEQDVQEMERPYTRADEQADLARAAYYDDVAQEQQQQQRYVPPVEHLAVEPYDRQENDRAIAVQEKGRTMLAEGLYLTPDMPFSKSMKMQAMVTSYTGVKPVKAMDFIGRWLTCIGVVYAPFERTGTKLNRVTGEQEPVVKRWKSPLFKLAEIDPSTGQHMILSGGGQVAAEFAQRATASGYAGDFPQPVQICFSLEGRTGVKEELDRQTGEITSKTEPRNLLRLAVRWPNEEEDTSA